ncbi:oxidoreductase [Paractinoplanes atraurantiacus]|uniref:2,4-dienoyl-CoA reductase n=1 Tax=Paractinoplanes atraurantiacus TaxID=1036182 RepID=A0A285HZZ7_9ACTN|nr:12-oxophytodienoate reductase [Actinoplanes atraurantiacus]SNY41279.1 2,4-dienoyl-CoA reductase [Actinoplanes atraurantiacus]
MMTTSALSEPVALAGMSLSSQFVMAPMTRSQSPGGTPTPRTAAYYRRRAENGVGLIITEGVLIDHPSAGHETDVPRMREAAWRLVTDEVHAAGGRIAAQLWHLGSQREPVDGVRAWTPSAVPEAGRPGTHAMSGRDFPVLLDAYARAARAAVRAGFDAVEIHAAHGYLLDEFLWPFTNRRADRFGADRAAFPAEVIRAVRAEIPASMPLIVRFSQFKERDYAARIAETPAELGAILVSFAAAGADVLHASQRRFWEPAFDGSPLNLAGWAKRLTGLPSITVGSVGLTRDFVGSSRMTELLDRRRRGEYDLIALGRVLLGNPAWVRLAGEGRLDEINDYRKADEDRYW